MSSRTPRRRGQPLKEDNPSVKKEPESNDTTSEAKEGDLSPNKDSLKRKLNEEYYCEVCEKSCNGPFAFAEHIRSAKHNKKIKSGDANSERSDAFQNMVNEISSLPVVDDSQFHKCDVCNVTVTGLIAYQQHTAGVKHYRNVQKQEVLNQVHVQNMDKYTGSDTATQKDSEFCCTVCDKTFSGPLPYRDHLKSKKHTARIGVIEVIREKSHAKGDGNKVDEDLKFEQAVLMREGEISSKMFEKASFECKLCNKKFSGIVPYVGHIKSKSHVKKRLLANLASKAEGTDANNTADNGIATTVA